jgi:hypothetical protein
VGAVARRLLGLHVWQAAHDVRGTVCDDRLYPGLAIELPAGERDATGRACSLQQSRSSSATRMPRLPNVTVARGVAADTLHDCGAARRAGRDPVLRFPCRQFGDGCGSLYDLRAVRLRRDHDIDIRTTLGQMENGAGGQITVVGGDGRPVKPVLTR